MHIMLCKLKENTISCKLLAYVVKSLIAVIGDVLMSSFDQTLSSWRHQKGIYQNALTCKQVQLVPINSYTKVGHLKGMLSGSS